MRVLYEVDGSERSSELALFTDFLKEQTSGVSVTPIVFSKFLDSVSGVGDHPRESVRFVMGSLFDQQISPEAVHLATRFRHSADFESKRFVALKLLNRVDLTGTFRFLEREVYLQAALLQAAEILLKEAPNIVVFRVTPHEFLPWVVSALASFMKIEVLHFQPCSMAPTMVPKLMSGKKVLISAMTAQHSSVASETRAIFRNQIARLSGGLPPRYMDQQRKQDSRQRGLRSRFLAIVKSVAWLRRRRFAESVDFSGHSNWSGIAANAQRILLTRSLQKNLRDSIRELGTATSSGQPYSVYAMHYEPERTSLPDGLPVDSQVDALLYIRTVIPPGEKVWVKEHYSQQSSALRGFLGRSPLVYQLIAKMPQTDFAPVGVNLLELVRNARAVFTLTGTIAIEASLMGVPVYYFGEPWWDGLPGSARIDFLRPQAFPPAIEGIKADVAAFLEDKVMNSMIPGLAGEAVATIERRLGPLPVELKEAELSAIAGCVIAILDGKTIR
jgi:hypothetical protein